MDNRPQWRLWPRRKGKVMKPERWHKIEKLYHSALEREADQRVAFLAAACADDDSLRSEVESLLANQSQAESLLETPVMEVAAKALADDQNSSMTGHSLGSYQILSLLGAGGMGEVYSARDTRLDRTVALKILPAEVAADAERMRRFVREAKAASALNHPHVATIYEIGEVGGVNFIAMEYIEGRTLAAEINGCPLDAAKIIEIGIQIADAFDEAHSKGITHRDIKPANLMFTARGQVKVLDFGLAKVGPPAGQGDMSQFSTQTTPGAVIGTVAYMSPEQALGREVDHRTDIFSLGVALYEMATGQRPFRGTTASETIDLILHAQPEAIAHINEQAPAELERIVGKCLEKERERRYQSAHELLDDLDRLKHGSVSTTAETQARPVAQKPRARSLSRSRFPLAVVAMAGATLIAALVYLRFYRTPHATSAPMEIKSLAVLPLENLSGDSAQEYFADGMTEELIATLAQVQGLRVISRPSVMRYKGTRKPIAEIAQELKVDAVITGAALRSGDSVRITAQLIRSAPEEELWNGRYEREQRNILALQSEVAREVVQEIRIRLTPQEHLRLARKRPVNADAYDYYMRGRSHANRYTRADNKQAIALLERAITLDSTFAPAWAEIAINYTHASNLFMPEEKQLELKAWGAVEKALSLDPDLAEAHFAKGFTLWTPSRHYPHEEAIQAYRRALDLNPSMDRAHQDLVRIYNHIGLLDEALLEAQKALAVNPFNAQVRLNDAQAFIYQGKYEQALATFQSIPKETFPELREQQICWALFSLGRKDEARQRLNDFLSRDPEDKGGALASIQAMLQASAGTEREAKASIESAAKKKKSYVHFHHTAYNIGAAYALMKKADPAIKWLREAADDGLPCYPLFANDPNLNNLRRDARFIALLAKLKTQWERYRAIL